MFKVLYIIEDKQNPISQKSIKFKYMLFEKLNHTKDQHTTPKCYLKIFSDDGKFIYRKFKTPHVDSETVQKEIKQPVSLKKATVVEDFYTVIGKEPMLIETLIYAREIEQHYQKIYGLLIDPNRREFDQMERTQMLMFFLSLHCRTPKQFKFFFDIVPPEYLYEMDKIKEDYKGAHVKEILPNFMAAHEFKRVQIFKITDTSEFITSDNPVLIIGRDNQLKNHVYREQFNIDNILLIPIDKKHCCALTHCLDKNGINAHGKEFYNKIERVDVDCSFTQTINWHMLVSAEKYFYGSEKYMNAFFSTYTLVDH